MLNFLPDFGQNFEISVGAWAATAAVVHRDLLERPIGTRVERRSAIYAVSYPMSGESAMLVNAR